MDHPIPSHAEHLRPNTFDEFVGQETTVRRLRASVNASLRGKSTLGHILLIGPPDSGRSTLATIVAKAFGTRCVTLNSITCAQSHEDFAGFLTNMEDDDLFILEDVQMLERRVGDFLREPLKDFKMSIVVDSGPYAKAVRLNLPHFTLIGTATCRKELNPAFVSGFQIVEEFQDYSRSELARIASQFAKRLGLALEQEVPEAIAGEGCICPRTIMNRLLMLRDLAEGNFISLESANQEFVKHETTLQEKEKDRDKTLNEKTGPFSRRYQVFVSSTYEDLKEERKHVMQALLETKCIPTGMELFPAASEEQWKLIQKVIDDCDYYVVILGGCYGSIGPSGKSFTEMEFDYAVSKSKSVIGFYHGNLDNLVGGKLEKDSAKIKLLNEFAKKVKTRICKPWTSAEGLASGIKSAIIYSIENDPKSGWVRSI